MSPALHKRPVHRSWRLLAVTAAAAVVGSGLVAPSLASAAVGVPTTYVDQAFASGVAKPTQDKPQSKLWHHDGAWWALMVNAGGTLVRIHELMPDHTWRDTGTVVDSRINSTGDAMWSTRDNRLYVASRASGSNLQVNGFSYNPANRSWAVAAGFPVTLNSGGGSESATVDQDSLGRLWVTYTRGSRVWVAHSTTSPATWTAPFLPGVPDTAISSDDLSALITFGTSVGVMWSDQQSGAFRFAIHNDADPDTVWRVENAWAGLADDHINLKQLVGDPQGRIFAAVKTSAGDATTDAPTDTLVGVLSRTPGAGGAGSWSMAPAGTVADDHTRPMIMIDETNRELYFFATAPVNGGDIYFKKAPLSNVSFPAGRGQRFVDAPFTINDATGAKEAVTAQTGMVVLASSSSALRYAHAEMELAGSTDTGAPTVTARTPAVNATGAGATANVTATFSEPVQGVDANTFRLTNTATGAVFPAVVSRNGTTNQWILDPTGTLAAGTRYTATLTGGATAIRDLANNPLTTVSWTFTTAGDTAAPTLTARSPAVNATSVGTATTNATATFSEPVQGVDTTTFRLTDPAGAVVPATVFRNGTTNQWVLDPSAGLLRDTRYTVTVTGGPTAIRDLAGNPVATATWSFLTGPPPTVSSRTPAVGATGVSGTADVTATFSEATQGVSGTTFTLRTTATGAAVTAVVSRNGTTNQWILNPSSTLPANTQFTVTITGGANGVRDLAGNPLAGNVTWNFTTAP